MKFKVGDAVRYVCRWDGGSEEEDALNGVAMGDVGIVKRHFDASGSVPVIVHVIMLRSGKMLGFYENELEPC